MACQASVGERHGDGWEDRAHLHASFHEEQRIVEDRYEEPSQAKDERSVAHEWVWGSFRGSDVEVRIRTSYSAPKGTSGHGSQIQLIRRVQAEPFIEYVPKGFVEPTFCGHEFGGCGYIRKRCALTEP